MSGYLSSKSAAAYLDMTPKAFEHWTKAHAVPCAYVGRQKRYRAADLDRVVRLLTLQAADARREKVSA